MKRKSFREFLSGVFQESTEVPIDKIRQAIFQYYSTAELMRTGANHSGKELSSKYKNGFPLNEDEKTGLLNRGIEGKLKEWGNHRHKMFSLDRERNVARCF